MAMQRLKTRIEYTPPPHPLHSPEWEQGIVFSDFTSAINFVLIDIKSDIFNLSSFISFEIRGDLFKVSSSIYFIPKIMIILNMKKL